MAGNSYTTPEQDELIRARYAFQQINEKMNGQWGAATMLESSEVGTKQYEDAVKAYRALKPEYDKALAAFDKAQAALDKIHDAKKKVEDRKNALKDTGGALDSAKKEYEKALVTEDAQRIADAKAALESARSAYAGKKSQLDGKKPEGKDVPLNIVNPYANTDDYVLGAGGVVVSKGKQIYLVTVPKTDGNAGDVVTNEFDSIASARTAYLKAYASTPEQIAALKKQLIASGYGNAAQMNSDKWYEKLDDAISAYSTHVVSQAQTAGAKQADLPSEFFKIKSTGAGGTGGAGAIQHTTRGTAKQAIDAYANDFLGRPATPEEADAYYKDLIKAETAGGTSGVVQAEVTMIAANVLRKSLKGTNVDELLKNASGSAVATDIADLQKTAANYGVVMSAADAMKYVAAGFGQKDYLAKQEERIKQTAIALHPQLKDHFMAGGTYKDIADQYKYAKQNKLGVVIDNSVSDSDISDAIAKGMSITDFKTALQAKPEWRKSPEAHDMVNGFLNNIAQTWGLG
jgi:tetratricopeptide (TPR) repeat protein